MPELDPAPSRVPVRRLLGFFAQLRSRDVAILGLVTLVLATVTPASVWLTQRATDAVVGAAQQGASLSAVLLVVMALALALFGGELIGQISGYFSSRVELSLTAHLRLLMARKVSRLEVQQLQDPQVHDRMERSTDDIAWRPAQLINVASELVVSVIGLAAAITIVASWDLVVGMLIALAAFPSMIAQALMAREQWLLEHQRTQLERTSDYYLGLLSDPRSVAELKSHRAEPVILRAFEKAIGTLLGLDQRQLRRHLGLSIIVSIISLVIMVIAVVMAVRSVLDGGTVGQFAGYLVALTAAKSSVESAGSSVSGFYENKLYLDEVVRFLDLPDSLIVGGTRELTRPNRGGLEVRNLSFTYPGREAATLHDISFSVAPGEVVGVVGANGAGKSTLIKLVNRLYDAPPGTIFWDAHPIEEYPVEEIRGAIAVVLQDFQRFEMTVAENLTITAGERWGDLALAQEVSTRTHVGELIARLPDGIEQQLGELFDGSRPLSGGQWQLLAIARALAGQPELLILDEPTSAFDAHTEARLFEDLSRLIAGTSCLLISHRFSSLRIADKIIVLDEGRIVEQGTHQDLMAAAGHYAEMYHLQASGYHLETAPPGHPAPGPATSL